MNNVCDIFVFPQIPEKWFFKEQLFYNNPFPMSVTVLPSSGTNMHLPWLPAIGSLFLIEVLEIWYLWRGLCVCVVCKAPKSYYRPNQFSVFSVFWFYTLRRKDSIKPQRVPSGASWPFIVSHHGIFLRI